MEILQKFLQLPLTVDNFLSVFQNFSQTEVDRRALFSFLTFSEFSERYIVNLKSYFR